MFKLNILSGLYKFARHQKKTFSQLKQEESKNVIISELDDRCLISIEGKDAKKVLQGITTNDIDVISNNKKYAALYTAFLNIKGRMVADAFIIKPRIFKDGATIFKEDEYWIDVHKELKQSLTTHVNRYCWKKNVKVNDIEDTLKICALYNDKGVGSLDPKDSGMLVEPPHGLTGDEGNYANLSFIDPRTPSLGMRMIMNGDEYKDHIFTLLPTQNYNMYTTLHGIAEGPEIVQKIPFQYNIDLLKGISFKKGCYIGQELIARSYYTGVVRRRAFPFILQDKSKFKELEKGKSLFNGNIEIGKVINFDAKTGIGLALISYLDMEPLQEQLNIKSPIQMTILNPLKQQIDTYIEELKEKQKKQEEIDS